MNPPPIPKMPPPLPPVKSARKNETPLVIAILGFALLMAFGMFAERGIGSAKVSAPPTATTETDPCRWSQRPSGVTREACERMSKIQMQLQREEEYERNPNYKPYAITPNR